MAKKLYFSVGDTTIDLKTSTPTISISSGVATFSVAQTGDLMVGDIIEIEDGATDIEVYLANKNSDTSWDVLLENAAPPSNVTAKTINSIKRTFGNISIAMDGVGSGSGSGLLIGSSDLVTEDIQLNITISKDLESDARCSIAAWTTDATRGIKIYAPYDTATECNNRHRHEGVWSDDYARIYRFDPSFYVLEINTVDYVTVEGLQIRSDLLTTACSGIKLVIEDHNLCGCVIRDNIIKDSLDCGIFAFSDTNAYMYIIQNIIYDVGVNGIRYGSPAFGTSVAYVYNNVVVNAGDDGVYLERFSSGTTHSMVARNNIVQDSGGSDYNAHSTVGVSDWDLDYCISSDDTADDSDTGVGNNVINSALTFKDKSGKDFSLAITDTDAIKAGIDLSSDPNYPFSRDILLTDWGSDWDMGAFKYASRSLLPIINRGINRGIGIFH